MLDEQVQGSQRGRKAPSVVITTIRYSKIYKPPGVHIRLCMLSVSADECSARRKYWVCRFKSILEPGMGLTKLFFYTEISESKKLFTIKLLFHVNPIQFSYLM